MTPDLQPESSAVAPSWLKVVLRVYGSVLMVVAAILSLKLLFDLIVVVPIYLEYVSPTDVLSMQLYLFDAFQILFVASIAFGAVLLRRWFIPLVALGIVSSFFVISVGLWQSQFQDLGTLFVAAGWMVDVIVLSLAWKYRRSLSGSLRNLWLQLPLFLIVLLNLALLVLPFLNPDQTLEDDSDLVLADVPALEREDNAYFVLSLSEERSVEEQEALSRIKDVHAALERGEDIDMDEALEDVTLLVGVTDRFIEASEKPGFQCPTSLNYHKIDVQLCDLNRIREIGTVVSVRSYIEASKGDTESAIRSAQSLMRMGRHLSAENPFVIEHLVGIALVKMGVGSLDRIVSQDVLAQDALSDLAQDLKTYMYDGQQFERALRREYMSQKESFAYFIGFGTYVFQINKVQNEMADRTRKQIRDAYAGCLVQPQEDAENPTSYWPFFLIPNSLGEAVIGVNPAVDTLREKECEVNALNEALQQKLK